MWSWQQGGELLSGFRIPRTISIEDDTATGMSALSGPVPVQEGSQEYQPVCSRLVYSSHVLCGGNHTVPDPVRSASHILPHTDCQRSHSADTPAVWWNRRTCAGRPCGDRPLFGLEGRVHSWPEATAGAGTAALRTDNTARPRRAGPAVRLADPVSVARYPSSCRPHLYPRHIHTNGTTSRR